MKVFKLFFLFLFLNFFCYSQNGVYSLADSTNFYVYPDYRTGILKISTNNFPDTLTFRVSNDGVNIIEIEQTGKLDTFYLDLRKLKFDTYRLTGYYKKQKIFKKYILLNP